MAHSCRWRFPARPGTGRRLGARHRLSAVLRGDVGGTGCGTGAAHGTSLAPEGHGNCGGVGPGFDAALQVSVAIGSNLRRFRDVSGGSSGEEDHFLGFGPDVEVKTRSPTKPPTDQLTPRKPRGRPRSNLSRSLDTSSTPAENPSPVTTKQDLRPTEKVKKTESKPEEKRRGRPPAHGSVKFKLTQEKSDGSESVKSSREEKPTRRKPSAVFQHAAKIKKLRTVKLSPLKPKFKVEKLQIGRKSAVQIVKRRGRPPSSERFKTTPPGIILRPSQGDKSQRGRKEDSPQPLKNETRVSVRQSPRRIKPVRIIPTSKRTDTTIAKQLLQKAKKGAQKKMELEAAKLQGRKGGTQLKNIRQFIMPVVSTVSSRIIKTPRRFIEDEDYEPPIKIARLESAPNGRFSAASCESSEKSSAASQQSSQATSDESRSSSPSVDTSTESQASEETPAATDTQECHSEIPMTTPQSAPENSGSGSRSRRLSNCNRGFNCRQNKKIISPSSLQQSSASPPPPLLSPPTSLQPPTTLSEHSTWVIPPTIPIPTPFLSASRLHEKRRSILREPTFRWTSRLESQYFSSAKYAKEGLIRKPIFDNFRPPPLTAEDVGLASGFSAASVVAPGRLFSPLHAAGRFDVPKRSPILRAPRFTPSEAHSRIFESVTLPPSVGRSGGASSMMGMASRRRKRRVFSPIRSSVSRSPSHSMRTRSRRENGNGGAASLIPQSSTSLAGISVSPLTASALNPSFPFSSTSITPAPGDSAEKSQKTRKQASTPGEHFTSSNSSPALFPLFPSSPQMDRGRSKSRISEEAPKERETERCREKEREKENSHDSRKDKRKKGSDPVIKSSKEKSDGEALTPATPIKLLPKKRTVTAEPSLPSSPPALPAVPVPPKNKVFKKGRGIVEKHDLEIGAKSPPTEPNTTLPAEPVNPVKSSTTTIGSMLDQANTFLASEKHVASLLRTAKCQLQNIEKSKLRKQGEQPKAQGQESDSSETSVHGPRIKHVCRRAAVALGRKRAVFPDDMPTLSALPWEEREKVLSSMGNDDKSSIAGSEDADPPAPPLKPIKQVTRNKTPQEPPVKKGRRSRRCGQCPGCQVPDDCGVCTNCLDKPKFGGRNIKKQCCKMRKCQNLQWMPSKAYLQKQAKAAKRKEKKTKLAEKKEVANVKPTLEPISKAVVAAVTITPSPVREEPPLTPPPPPKKSDPPKKVVEEKPEEESQPALTAEVKQPPIVRKVTKQLYPQSPVNQIPRQISPPPTPSRKEVPKLASSEPRKKQPFVLPEPGSEQNKQKKLAARVGVLLRSKSKEKEKPLAPSKPDVNFNLLNTLCNGGSRQKHLPDGVHRIRVDFKEDCEVGNVWEMGGLNILTTVPITPRVVCFLCASSGNVEFVFCQVCCEPFHRFCLEERERPSEDQLENWCCRICKFCHVCGRQQQVNKQLLECNKCRNSYHPECLGPNYPKKPTKKKRVWICTKCVRCKSCGSTTPGKGWDAQWSNDFSLCFDCSKQFAKGNFCPLCNKCYDDDDYESKMMQCGKCDRWVHSKCESLTDEMYEILSKLPESVAYTCINCTDHHPAEWRLALNNELQDSLEYVLTALLNSRTSSHLLRYRQSAKPPDLNPEPEENMPSRSSPEGPDPPVLIQVGKQDEQPPPDLDGVKKKMDLGRYTSVLEMSDDIVRIIQAAMNADGGQPEMKKANSMVKSFFTKQMERIFPWFSVKKSRFWEPNKVASNSSMLPNAVLPPSLDHNYAQWQERENGLAVQPALVKKIIPAPKAKSPGDPESPPPPQPTPPATDHSRDENVDLPPPPGVEDNRQCALCLKYGDDNANDAGRLLYIGQDEWTHINCALWSAEVFEDDDGSLKNVHMAVIRGKQLRCEHCQKLGATVGCCLTSCTSNYHFMCSRVKNCVFLEDKKVYCQKHRDLIKGEVVSDNNFEVLRRVVVDFEGINLRRKFLNGLDPDNIHMMIGSMTVDCLGILSDLSDCEEKLFPIGYQCSRVYWSTTDARKRCVYTCKIMECRPPPVETDINSTVHHEENRTIAHSPPRDEMHELGPHRVKHVDIVGLPSPEPLSSAFSTRPAFRPSAVGRARTNRYSTNQRFPGPRPLPSAGSPVTHEIVTVGDPVLSSGLRSIGSRRHSASSISPQLPKSRAITTSHTEATRLAVSQSDTTPALADHRSTNVELGGVPSKSVNPSSCVPSNGHRILGTKGDKPLETRRAGSLEVVSKIPKTDKVKSLAQRSSDFSTNQSSTKVPAQPQGLSTSDSSTSRASSAKDFSPVVHGSKSIASHQHQRAIKRENDPNADSFQAERTPSSEKVQDTHLPLGNHGVTVTKDRRLKSRNQLLESAKDKHSSKSTTDSEQVQGEPRSQIDSNGSHFVSDTGGFKTHAHNKNVDKSAAGTESSPTETSTASSCKAIKPKVALENTSDRKLDKQTMSPHEQTDIKKSQDSSEYTDDSAANHRSPNTDSEPQAGNAYPDRDANVLLQDGNKTQEGSSYKRRYPRRSARARSNMFFGLTPLYGVRSYGEEDLPFCSSTPGKKRGKRAAEGQVDGADDLSSSEDDDVYYYNFSRTVVSAADDRLGVRNLFREDDRKLHRIPQLDGVDDGIESDTSITITTGKSGHTGKRSNKQNGAEKLVASDEQLEKSHTAKGSKGSDVKMESCHPVKQDSLENQLSLDTPRRTHGGADKNLLDSFNTELLKSDSDNNNSDDCGNILPIDIMDFVLKNTPAMQTLGESPESSSSELLTLGDGLGLDNNRGKDMGLFEVFSQQLPSSEPVDGTVPSTMSAEEQFELPLELPSDLSVLTTRSPSLPSQNHSRLGVIPDSQLSTTNERSLLSLPNPDTGEKRVTVTEKPVTSSEGESDLLAQNVDRTPERHMTPDRFIAGHLDSEHISSPPCGQVDHAAGQELTRNSSTPNLQVPVSPSVPIQNQKYIPSTSESPGPSQMQNTAIQSTSPHLKSTTEKVVVVNQNMQPLYVLQTLPNGVTQKIQLTPSVPPGSSRMDADVSVLSQMGTGFAVATTLNPTLTSPFPPAGKGLLPVAHHPHLQPFPTTQQTAFLPGLTNQSSGLLIGVQPTAESQLLVSESGQRSDLGNASNPQTSGLSKKRQISRLHTKKNKKLAPSVAPALRQPPEVVSNMTLINFTAPQLTGSLPNHPNLIDLGSLGNAAPHRSIPNIIKRSKSGVMYFDQTPLLPQNLGTSNSVGAATSVIGLDHGHLTGQVPAIATGSSILNVVSMQTTATPAPVSGHVTLTSPGILGPSELGSIGNFLIKTSPQGLGIQDNHVALPSGPGIFSQSPTTATLATTSSICVVPTSQSVGMTLAQTVNDQDCSFQIPHHMNRLLSNRHPILPDSGGSDHRSSTHALPPDSEGKTMNSTTSSSTSGPQRVSSSAVQKPKIKGKRQANSAEKTSRKKYKSSHSGQGSTVAQDKDKSPGAILAGSIKPKTDGYDINAQTAANVVKTEKIVGSYPATIDADPLVKEQNQPEPKQDDCKPEDDAGFSSPLMRLLQHEQRRQDSLQGPKPRTGLLFEISSDDGFQISANSIEEAWKSLTDKVQEARSNARLKQLSFAGVNGLKMLGILHDAVVFLVEQLYGANKCRAYKFRFHRPAGEEEPPINPHGSARAEINQRKSAFDMFNFLASKHRQPPEYKPNDEEEEEVQLKCVRRATSMDLPMPMRFRHLKKTSKEAVGVYRSPIHGRGLFCKRNIDAGEMVIEYSGNVVRSTLTDKKEKYYDGKGIGCYMFRIDDSEVVDATMHGNAARFINHSCEPNCYSRVIPIDGQKHIYITLKGGIGCYMFRIDDSEVVDATMHGNAARFINHSCEPNCYSRVIPIDGQKHIYITLKGGIGCYMFRIDDSEVVDATMHGNAARFINHSCEPNCYSRVIPIDGQKHIYITLKGGIGCYMFRIDDSEVVDATMHGNAARFINHSCEPNCYSRVIPIDGQKHIVIFAMRKIYRGEELTYDYKFPIEDASNKLACNCGTKKCRKFLN